MQEPVKSIEEIVRAHSSSCLTVPPLARGPQRSVSWSASNTVTFRKSRPGRSWSSKKPRRRETRSHRKTLWNVETRTMLQSVQIAHLERVCPTITRKARFETGTSRRSAQQTPGSRSVAPPRSSQSTSHLDSLSRKRRGLTCCAQSRSQGHQVCRYPLPMWAKKKDVRSWCS